MPLFAPGQALHVVCKSCGQYKDLLSNRTEKRRSLKAVYSPLIKVGTRFELDDLKWVCLSFGIYKETKAHYSWREYGLFEKETNTFAWLIEFDGHWSLAYTADEYLFDPKQTQMNGHLLYHRYGAKLTEGYGEFLDDVSAAEIYKVSEFINPPTMLSWHTEKDEAFGIKARYVTHRELKKALPDAALPQAKGIGAIQPVTFAIPQKLLNWMTFIIIAALLTIEVFANAFEPGTLVGSYTVQRDTSASSVKNFIIKNIRLPREYNNLEVRIDGNMDNQWAEVEGDLIGSDSRSPVSFGSSVEHYSGYEDGESWSEGSNENEVFLPSIKRGDYVLDGQVTFSDARYSTQVIITVFANVGYHSNLYFLLLLVLAYPLYVRFIGKSKNKSRWANSDYAHLHFGDDD